MPKIIFLNGPPRSGKDSLGLHLALTFPWVRLYKLISPAEDFVRAVWRLPREEYYSIREARKDEKLEMFSDRSLRDVFIRFSEQFMKPAFGPTVFGDLAVRRLQPVADYDVIVITDSGFAIEAMPIARTFGVENCLKVEIERMGCSFTGDSRSYWPPLPGMASVRIRNEGSIDDFCRDAAYILAPYLKATQPVDAAAELLRRTDGQ